MSSLARCVRCGQVLSVFEGERFCPDCTSYTHSEDSGPKLADTGSDVSPYVAMCGREVVETGWDLETMLRGLVGLAKDDKCDFAVWEDEMLVAAVFSNGKAVICQHVGADNLSGLHDALEALKRGDAKTARQHLQRARVSGKPHGTVQLMLIACDLAEKGQLGMIPSLMERIEAGLNGNHSVAGMEDR